MPTKNLFKEVISTLKDAKSALAEWRENGQCDDETVLRSINEAIEELISEDRRTMQFFNNRENRNVDDTWLKYE